LTVRSLAARSTATTRTVSRLTVGPSSTLVSCRRPGSRADADLAVSAVPDHVGARRLRGALGRVAWVSLDLTGGVPACQVAGVRRHPVRVSAPVAVGLALIDGGAPGVVRTRGGAPR
jgi:hypothetical protein